MASLSHAQARSIIDEAWRQVHARAPTLRESIYTQAIAFLETGYGRAGQFSALADRGLFNWGALERHPNPDGTCPAGTASGSDVGSVCFYVFPSDVSAAAAFIRNLTTRHWPIIFAMQGTPEDVARAMRVRPAYYEGLSGTEEDRIQTYATAIRNAIRSMGVAVPTGREAAQVAGTGVGTLLVLGVLGAGGYWLYKNRYLFSTKLF